MKVGIIGSEGLMGKRRRAHLEPDDESRSYDVAHSTFFTLDSVIDWAEACIVAVPHDQLAPMAMKCVEAGKHVLLEKPCARSVAELLPVARAAEKAGVVVVPGFTLRHYPGIGAAAELLAERDPLVMRAVYGHPGRPDYGKEWRCDRSRGGGQLLDQGMHLIDLACALLGFSQEDVSDYAERSGQWSDVEDNVAIRLGPDSEDDSAERPLAILQASWTEPAPIFRLEVTCRGGGGFRVDGLGGGYGPHRVLVVPSRDSHVWKETGWEDPRSLALTREWRQFKDHVAEGKSQIAEALRALAIADRCKRFIEDGRLG